MAAHRRRPGFHGAAAGADPLHADGLGDHGAGAADQGHAGGRLRQDRRRGRRGAAAEARLHRHGQAPQPGGCGRPPRAGAGRRSRRRPVPPRDPALRRRAGRELYLHPPDGTGPEMRIKSRRLAHRVTTAHLQAAYPFISEGGLGSDGVYIGRDVFGGSFCYCPFTLYGKEITGPNMLVIGQIGYAKSSLVKCLDEDSEIIDPVTGVPRTIAEVFKDEDVTRVLTLDPQRRITAVPITAKVDVGLYDWALTGHTKFTEPPNGACACGCGAPTPIATRTRNGNVKGQPRRYADGHSSRRGAAATVLRRFGVPRALSRQKVLPEIIYRLPPDQLARFVGVFWMCDGTVAKTGVSTTLASERLVRQLQHLLLRFGIQSKVRFHRSTLNGKPYPSWQLRVYSQSDQAFLSQIPLWGTKRERLAALCAGRSRAVQANVGAPSLSPAMRARLDAAARLPDGRSDTVRFKRVAERLGASYRFQFSHIVNSETGRLNRPGFRAFCEVFGLMDEYGWLLDSDVYWDRIVSIEAVGERHVYDLTVEPTACFVANDILVHNTYVWRQMLFGRTAWVIDPKGEYDQLAAFCGSEPIRFRSGGSLRLNPLDPMIGGDAQLALLRSIAGVMLGRNLRPEEDACLERAHHEAVVEANNRHAQPTIPQVVNRLLEPSDATAHELRTSIGRLAEDGRQLALALRRMGAGDLRGMFDGPTSRDLDLSGRLVVFNLREVKDEARPILMACTAAWLQGSWARNDGVRRILVLDEAWVVLRHLAIARWLRESWKLARQYGVQNIAVMHRLSDLTAAGDAGSEQVQLAKGLLEDSETRVIYRQSPGEVEQARELLGLTQTECDQIPSLERGEALWRVGRRSFIVQHRIDTTIEREIVDTDANMDPRSAPWAVRARSDEAAEGAS